MKFATFIQAVNTWVTGKEKQNQKNKEAPCPNGIDN